MRFFGCFSAHWVLLSLASQTATLAGVGAAAKPCNLNFKGYVFAYFTGNTIEGEKIYFAASQGNDALSWSELNGGGPALSSKLGTGGLRDPFIMRSYTGDRFYLIATDLSIGSGTSWDASQRNGSRHVEIWESTDLVSWGEQRHVLVSPPTAGNTWAPEALYDEAMGKYLLFWSSQLFDEADVNHTGSSYERVLYATTEDFVTFSDAVVWEDSGISRIDSTVLKDGKTYYRFTKDEGSATGCTDIIQERSTDLAATLEGWRTVATCIGKKAGTGAVEGPTSFKSNPGDVNGDKYYLFVDEYTSRGYIPLETKDIAKPNWTVSDSYRLPTSPRHGTVMPITARELSRLTGAGKVASRSYTHDVSLAKRANPALPGYYADPNIAIFGCNYYIFATTDGYAGWGGNHFFVWKSRDLASWNRSLEPILTLDAESGNVPWANGNAWAPTIIERYGRFYFYFSGNNIALNTKTIGVAVAKSPDGPYVAEPEAMILNNERIHSGQAIDPCAFFDPVTRKYFLFWGNGSPLYAEFHDNMTSIRWDTAAAIDGLTDFREGIFVNYHHGLYHITYSIDDTGSENYRVGYATARSVHGPWTSRGVILQKDASQGILATGHDSIVNVPGTDDWYIAYHRFHIPDGDGTHREVSLDKIDFDGKTGFINTVHPTLIGPKPRGIPGCRR